MGAVWAVLRGGTGTGTGTAPGASWEPGRQRVLWRLCPPSGTGVGGVFLSGPPPPPRAEAALWGRGNSLSVSVTAVRPQWGSLLSGELGFLSSPAAPEG